MKILGTSNATPQSSPPPSSGWESERFVWERLVPLLVHPLKLAIIEALLWVGQPLAVEDLMGLFSPVESSSELVRYHVKSLAQAGVLETAEIRAGADGPEEPRYFFIREAPG